MKSKHGQFMRKATSLSEDNLNAFNGGPFGAVIVKDGEIISAMSNSGV